MKFADATAVSCAAVLFAIAAGSDGGGSAAGLAASSVRPSFKCQRDYQLVGQVCVQTEYAEYQYECPKSAKKMTSGTIPTCYTVESFASRAVCPPDYYAVLNGKGGNGSCERVHQVPFRFECDDAKFEMIFHPGQSPACSKRTESDPHFGCPKDFKLDHKTGTCVKNETVMPTKVECPKSARLISRNDKSICEFQETAEHRFNCPKGYTFLDESSPKSFAKGLPVCHRVEVQLPKAACPRGYKLDGVNGSSRCVRRTEKGSATPFCDEGTLSRSGKKCEVVERRLAVAGCPRQQTLRNGRCAAKPETVCESGWSLVQAGPGVAKAFCEKKSLGPSPRLRCPPNSILQRDSSAGGHSGGTTCIVEEFQTPHLACPPGFDRAGPTPGGVRHLNSGGNVVSINVSASKKGSTKRKLREALRSDQIGNVWPEAASHWQSGTTTTSLDSLSSTFTVETSLKDEINTVDERKGDEIKSVEGVKQRRKGKQQALAPPPGSRWSGSLDTPLCIKKHVAGVEVTCPKSFTVDMNHNYQPGEHRCIATRRTHPIPSCPQGSLPRGHHCEQVTVIAPRQECKKGARLSNGICVEQMEKPAIRRCPRKFTLDDNAESCVQVDRVKPDRICPRGVPKGDKCEVQLPVDPVPSCPKSYVAAGNKCQRSHAVDAKPVCPSHHHKYEGGFCVK